MKIIIAVDKFKGSLSSVQVAEAARRGVKAACPDAITIAIPVADGGDGTVDAVVATLGSDAATAVCQVASPLPHLAPVDATYAIVDGGRTAVTELAQASGLALVPTHKRDAMAASTLGTGQMIANAIAAGCRHVVVGLGGSAPTDGGTGLLSALGFRWLDSNGREVLPCGANLSKMARVDDSAVPQAVRDTKFTLWTDVTSPLCGPQGAARVFAPQKGADANQVELLEAGLAHLATLMPPHVPTTPGAGAAGGTAAGMMAWLGASVEPGAEALLSMAHIDEALRGASLVITGEGRIDDQTAMGKAPAVVLSHAHQAGVPVLAITGCLATNDRMDFDAVLPIVPRPMTEAQAMQPATAATQVERTVEQAVRLLLLNLTTNDKETKTK